MKIKFKAIMLPFPLKNSLRKTLNVFKKKNSVSTIWKGEHYIERKCSSENIKMLRMDALLYIPAYPYISAEEACTVWCYKRSGGSKSRGWTFPDGTTCQSHRSRYGKSMYCISGRCEVSSPEHAPISVYSILSF
jgi:hypothetical protein